MKITLRITFVMIFALAAFGCHRDSADLKKTILYFYSNKKQENFITRNLWGHRNNYNFLSTRSKLEISKNEWKNIEIHNYDSPRVLRQERRNGKTYAIVSIHTYGINGSHISTNTWILEGSSWKLLLLPKTLDEISASSRNEDPSTTIHMIIDYIKIDPFSIAAYKELANIDSKIRMADVGTKFSDEAILQTIMSINPDDTLGLFAAIRITDNPGVAKIFLDKLIGTDAYEKAFYNYALMLKPIDRVELFREIPSTTMMNILRVVTYTELSNVNELSRIFASPGFEANTMELLENANVGFTTYVTNEIVEGAFYCGNQAMMSRWIEFGLRKNPNHKELKSWAEAMESASRFQTKN